MGPHFSQAEITWTATKWELERYQHDLGRAEGGAVIDCRAGCMAQETNNHLLQIFPRVHKARIDRHDAVLSYLGCNLRRQRGSRRAALPEAGRAEKARYCDNNGHTWTGDRCPNCRQAIWPRERQDCQNQKVRRQSWQRTGHTARDRSNQHPSSADLADIATRCPSVLSSPIATSIVQPLSRSEDDIAQRRLPSHPLGAACRSQAQSTSKSCICN